MCLIKLPKVACDFESYIRNILVLILTAEQPISPTCFTSRNWTRQQDPVISNADFEMAKRDRFLTLF